MWGMFGIEFVPENIKYYRNLWLLFRNLLRVLSFFAFTPRHFPSEGEIQYEVQKYMDFCVSVIDYRPKEALGVNHHQRTDHFNSDGE